MAKIIEITVDGGKYLGNDGSMFHTYHGVCCGGRFRVTHKPFANPHSGVRGKEVRVVALQGDQFSLDGKTDKVVRFSRVETSKGTFHRAELGNYVPKALRKKEAETETTS